MKRVKTGNIIIATTLILTSLLWFLSKSGLNEIVNYPLSSVNQITALMGTLLLSWGMLLMTRLDFLEDMFEGLNNVYTAHKKTSIWGIILIIIHVVALVFERLPNINQAFNLFLPLHKQPFINLGVFSFWLFILFITIALLRIKLKLPYHTWKTMHKFAGIALVLAFIHIILIPRDNPASMLNFWLIGTTGIGIASWIYYELFYKILTPSYKHEVSEIIRAGDVFKIKLTSIGRKMKYKPGQFVYLSFIKSAIEKEIHPFTITSHPNEKELSFAIKVLGDYTATLNKLKVGDIAQIWGPYGRFADRFLNTNKDVIFIGGGIGIASFLGMIKEEKRKGKNRSISLFYCTKYKCDACFDAELKNSFKDNPNFFYLNKCSRTDGRLSIPEIIKRAKDIKGTLIFVCGPKRMVSPLINSLTTQNIPSKNIISEYFNF